MDKVKRMFLVIILSGLFVASGHAQVDTNYFKVKFDPNKSAYAKVALKRPITAKDSITEAMLVYELKNGADTVISHLFIDTVSYKDTLKAGTISKTYSFGKQYPHVKVMVKYDSIGVGNDTLKIYNVGNRGDTSEVYVLDSANNRVSYIVNSGDMKFKEYRLDILCPDNLIFKYSDAEIFTTKFIFIPKGVKY